MFDIILSLVIEILVFAFFLIFGMVIIPHSFDNRGLNDNKIVLFTLAPIVGFAFWLGINAFLVFILPFNRVTTYIFLFLMIIIIILFRNRLLYFREVVRLKNMYIYWILLILSSIIVIYVIIPKIIDGGIYFCLTDYDHSRVAVVNSIMRNGIPFNTPYISYNGELVKCSYHIGIHILMAQISFIFNVKSIVSVAVVYGLVYIYIFMLCAMIIYIFSKRKISFMFMTILFFSIAKSDSDLYFENIEEYGKVIFGFWPIFDTLLWTSHHIIAGAIVLIIVYLYAYLITTQNKNLIYYSLIGVLATAACISSIYSGVFPLVFFVIIIAVVYFFNKEFRNNFNKTFLCQLFAIFVGVSCSLPYLLSLLQFSVDKNETETVFELLKITINSHSGTNILLSFLEFYFVKLPINLGISYVFGFIVLFYIIIKLIKGKGIVFDNKLENNKSIVMASDIVVKFYIYYIILTFAIIYFFRSDFYTNDFGWRIVIPAEIILLCFASILSTKIYDFLKSKNIFLLIIFLFSYFSITIFCFNGVTDFLNVVCVENVEMHKEFANAVKGWDVVNKYTNQDDIVLCNPDSYKELYNKEIMLRDGKYGANIFFTHYANRNTLIADYNYSLSSGEAMLGEKYIKDLYDFAVSFYSGNPTEDDVKYLCDVQKVKAILVTPYDELYNDEGMIRSRYPNKIQGKDYKVYFSEDIKIE